MKVLQHGQSSGRSTISLNTEVQIHAWSSSPFDGSALIKPRLPCITIHKYGPQISVTHRLVSLCTCDVNLCHEG